MFFVRIKRLRKLGFTRNGHLKHVRDAFGYDAAVAAVASVAAGAVVASVCSS